MQIMSDDVYFRISGSVNVFVLFTHDHVEQAFFLKSQARFDCKYDEAGLPIDQPRLRRLACC